MSNHQPILTTTELYNRRNLKKALADCVAKPVINVKIKQLLKINTILLVRY